MHSTSGSIVIQTTHIDYDYGIITVTDPDGATEYKVDKGLALALLMETTAQAYRSPFLTYSDVLRHPDTPPWVRDLIDRDLQNNSPVEIYHNLCILTEIAKRTPLVGQS